MEPMFLSKDEVIELTGYKVPALQCRWLRDRGWVFEQNRNNRPIVGRGYAKSRLGGGDLAAPIQGGARPNFAALRGR